MPNDTAATPLADEPLSNEIYPGPCDCPEDPSGCATETSPSGQFKATFYKGFASSITASPNGGSPETVYQQKDVYFTNNGKGNTNVGSKFRVRLEDVAGSKDVMLLVDNAPLDYATQKGPVKCIEVTVGNPAQPWKNEFGSPVMVTQGKQYVINVVVNGSGCGTTGQPGAGGGQKPRGEDDGDGDSTTWVINNNAQTCPAECK